MTVEIVESEKMSTEESSEVEVNPVALKDWVEGEVKAEETESE